MPDASRKEKSTTHRAGKPQRCPGIIHRARKVEAVELGVRWATYNLLTHVQIVTIYSWPRMCTVTCPNRVANTTVTTISDRRRQRCGRDCIVGQRRVLPARKESSKILGILPMCHKAEVVLLDFLTQFCNCMRENDIPRMLEISDLSADLRDLSGCAIVLILMSSNFVAHIAILCDTSLFKRSEESMEPGFFSFPLKVLQ